MDRERRLILKVGLATAAGVAAGCGSGGATNGNGADMAPVCSGNAIGVGDASDVALNAVVEHMTPTTNVFICRDADGIYAMDVRCTHMQCDVMPNDANNVSKGFLCPCHQSTFDANGEHPTGLAPSPLPHYQVCAQPSGALIVDVTVTVAADTRLKI